MPPIVNLIAGIVCVGLSFNFFRLANKSASTDKEISVEESLPIKCQPSGDLLNLSKDELLERCGKPDNINHQTLSYGALRKEQWSYRKPTFYIYLQNGIVESIQYAENGQNFEWKN